MDELKTGLKMDRLSCHRFMANFFRLLLHVGAMNLLNAQCDDGELPEVLRKGQPCTWRTQVIKVAAEIVQSTRRVLVKIAANWPLVGDISGRRRPLAAATLDGLKPMTIRRNLYGGKGALRAERAEKSSPPALRGRKSRPTPLGTSDVNNPG